jgi:triosephosphate isomerase
MKTPAIIVNFKTYKQATGKDAIKLAKICEEVAREKGVEIVVCPQMLDCAKVREAVNIPVFAQHVDDIDPGSHTGWILIDSLIDLGLDGSLVNHSEHRIENGKIEGAVKRLKDADMTPIVCTKDVSETGELSKLKPDFVAIEPPELIGTGVSVSTAQPELITGAVDAAEKGVPVLCGAGIAKGEDIKAALELGAEGVLLASGVTKAEDPKKVLSELADYMLKA